MFLAKCTAFVSMVRACHFLVVPVILIQLVILIVVLDPTMSDLVTQVIETRGLGTMIFQRTES